MGPRTGLDVVAKRQKKIASLVGNQTRNLVAVLTELSPISNH